MRTMSKAAAARTQLIPTVGLPSVAPVQATVGEMIPMEPTFSVTPIVAELQALQRQRAVIIKSRNMQANRLQALVAGTLGYHSGMPEKERTKKFTEASALIKEISKGGGQECPFFNIVLVTLIGIDAFNEMKVELEKKMVGYAKQLPVAKWVEAQEQRGFGTTTLLSLAIVIGECGDLANYANPGKVWRRMGCAPHTFGDRTAMGATWKSGKEGKLPATEWEQFGYSPRRRSIAYLIGEGLMKQNLISEGDGDDKRVIWKGPYRERYETGRAVFAEKHPDYSPKRCQLHGMLLATKLLLKNLWIEWNQARGVVVVETDSGDAAC